MYQFSRMIAAVGLTVLYLICPMEIQARSTNAFQIGQVLSADQMSKIPKTRQAVYEQTVGRVTQKAVLKHGTVEAYIQARGVKATAGKVFEAMTVNRFRAYAQNGEKLISTASIGLPNDVADLYRISSDGVVLDRYQLKAGYRDAVKAPADPKYVGIKIATHPEQLEKIKRKLHKMKLREKPLTGPWSFVDEAIRSGRLTDTIGEMPLSTHQATIQQGNRYIRRMFVAELRRVQVKLGPSAQFPTGNFPGTSAIIAGSRTTVKSGFLLTKISFKLIAPVDVAYSGYRMYDTVMRRHEYDGDIYASKLVVQGGLAGTGLAGIGLGLLAAPEPTFVTKVAGGVILITSVVLGGTDIGLDYAHTRRLDERSRQLARLDVRSKHEAVDHLLRNMVDNSIERYY